MANNLYEMIATRDAQMVKFLDENIEISRCFKKMIGLLSRIAVDWKVPADSLHFDVRAMTMLRDGDTIVVRVKRKNE